MLHSLLGSLLSNKLETLGTWIEIVVPGLRLCPLPRGNGKATKNTNNTSRSSGRSCSNKKAGERWLIAPKETDLYSTVSLLDFRVTWLS